MKSSELIKRLQELDPAGNNEVCLGGDISEIYTLPYYYDGRAQIFIKDDDGDIVGIRQATEKDGDKIVIVTKNVEDLAWEKVEHELDTGKPKTFIIEGDNHFMARYDRGILEAKEVYEKIILNKGNTEDKTTEL